MSKVTTFRASDGKSYLCVTARRCYSFRNGAVAEPIADTTPLAEEPEYVDSTTSSAERLVSDIDFFAGTKPATDVLLRGTAYSHQGPVPCFDVILRVGPIAKTLRIHGDRTIRLEKGDSLSSFPPVPRASLPLIWDHAYGGRDEYAEKALFPSGSGEPELGTLSYPRNPAGCGFFIDMDRERMAGAPMPNIEDPLDPITPDRLVAPTYGAWIDCPAAACFEPIDIFTFPRAVFCIPATFETPRRSLYEEKVGFIQLEEIRRRMEAWNGLVDPRAFNCAPAGLSQARLKGDERVELFRLHEQYETCVFHLPADRPRLLLEPPGVNTRELAPSLQTVLIEPDRDCVTLTWAGTLEVAVPYPLDMVENMRHAVIWER